MLIRPFFYGLTMDDTFVFLWRKITDTIFYKNPNICHLAIHCIIKANFKDRNVIFNNQIVELKKGQFITGRKKLSEETGLTQQQTRTALKVLEKCRFLTSKSTNKYSIITVLNYKEYQFNENTINQQSNQQVTSNQPASNQQVTTDNKDNKDNKEKKERDSFYPDWLDINLWKDFLDHRKHISKDKKPLSDRAEKLNITELKKFVDEGYSQEQVINLAISRGWKGFYRPKDKPKPTLPDQTTYKTDKQKKQEQQEELERMLFGGENAEI